MNSLLAPNIHILYIPGVVAGRNIYPVLGSLRRPGSDGYSRYKLLIWCEILRKCWPGLSDHISPLATLLPHQMAKSSVIWNGILLVILNPQVRRLTRYNQGFPLIHWLDRKGASFCECKSPLICRIFFVHGSLLSICYNEPEYEFLSLTLTVQIRREAETFLPEILRRPAKPDQESLELQDIKNSHEPAGQPVWIRIWFELQYKQL